MDDILEGAGYACLLFLSWKAKTFEELKGRLLLDIADKLGLHENKAVKAMDRGKSVLRKAWQAGRDENVWFKIADTVASPAITWAEETHENGLIQRIAESLKETRLVIFVDDLDRARPEVLPELLLNLREVLNLPNVHYVLGLSPQIVQEGLADVHKGWKSTTGFLEKIVEYPAYLPEPSENHIRLFIRHQLEKLHSSINKDVLEDLNPYLPRNPRRLKTFLRSLSSLGGLLGRFDPGEINIALVYLCQMLRLEFPEEARSISRDKEVIKGMQEHGLNVAFNLMSKKESKDERPELKYKPQQGSERFLELCQAIKEANNYGTEYGLVDVLIVFDNPPILTRKETEQVFRQFVEAASEAEKKAVLRSALTHDISSRASALLVKTVQLRTRLLNHVAHIDSLAQQQTAVRQVADAGNLLKILLQDFGVVREGWTSIEDWKAFEEELTKQAHFLKPEDVYAAARNDEVEILYLAVAGMPVDMMEALLEDINELSFARTRGISKPSAGPELIKAYNDIGKTFSESVADRLLERFQRADGIEALWRYKHVEVQKQIAYDASSVFHSKTYRERLYALADTAGYNEIVQRNFLEFFQMLVYLAADEKRRLEYGRLEATARILASDASFTARMWSASVAQPLNLRVVGELKTYRSALLEKLRVPESVLPEPDWYKAMVEQYLPNAEPNIDQIDEVDETEVNLTDAEDDTLSQ